MDAKPHPFSLRQLQYVVAVADLLSFRKAALRCRVAQPSLSAQVASIEYALDVQLFERSHRRVLVTAAGQALVVRAREVLRAADDVTRAAELARDPLAGTLRIGVIPTISPYLLPALAPALRLAFPRLVAVWVEGKTGDLARALAEGSLDAAIVALESELGDVEHALIANDPFVLAAPKGHPLAAGRRSVRAADLRDTAVLLLSDGHCFRDQALGFCAAAGAEESGYVATSLSTLVQMVAAGLGVTVLPSLAVAVETGRADLCVRPFARPAPFRTIALVWRRGSPLGPALAQLAAVAKGAC